MIKTDVEGNEEWRNTYGDDYVHNYGNVKQTSDGGYIIVGTRWEGSKGTQVYMVKTDINGDLSWDRNYGGDYQDRGRDVIETGDGGYIAVGTLHLIGGDMNIYLVKTDSNGALQWGENFGTDQRDDGDSIQKTDDGYLIFGHTYDGLDQNPYIVKTDTGGEVEWSRIISEFEASAVTQTTDGGFAFSSMCQDNPGDLVFPCIIKTDSTFTEEWRWSWESESATNYNMPAIQQTADQGFMMAGSAFVPVTISRSTCMVYLIYYDPADPNTAPTVPSLNQPADDAEVTSLTPSLSVNNSSDVDGQPLTYYFELYIDESLEYMETSADVDEGTGGITTWQIAEERDDHKHYWWRCRAYDGLFYSDWMAPAHFKVNTANEAPGMPTLDAPENGSNVTVLQPTLTSVINAWNGDEDAVTYEFEVYADEGDDDPGCVNRQCGGGRQYYLLAGGRGTRW